MTTDTAKTETSKRLPAACCALCGSTDPGHRPADCPNALPVYDQGEIASSSAFAVAAAIEQQRRRSEKREASHDND